MIKKENLTNQVCLKCHSKFANDIQKHTGHNSDSEGSVCYNCHMPKIVYGIMTLHRSHKIESPNPASEFKINKPNACSACHTDKTDQWIDTQSNKIWPKLKHIQNDAQIIHALYKLHSGDPVERSVAANNLFNQSASSKPFDNYFKIPHLLFAMSDNYPAIRRFSFKSLKNILTITSTESNQFYELNNSIQNFDFISEEKVRTNILKHAWQEYSKLNKDSWPQPPIGSLLDLTYIINIKELIKLRDLSLKDTNQINIGE